MSLTWMKSKFGFRKIFFLHVSLSNLSLDQTTVRLGCHGRCRRRVHAQMCSPPTVAPCTRAERTIPIDPGTPLPAHKDDVYIDDLVILSVLQYDFFQMRSNAGKSCRAISGDFWEGRLDGVSGTLGLLLNAAPCVATFLSMWPALEPLHCRQADDVD